MAAAEMAFAGGIGLTLDLSHVPVADAPTEPAARDVVALFGESSGRFLVEVAEEDGAAFEAIVAGADSPAWAQIGRTGGDGLRVYGSGGAPAIDVPLDVLKRAWQGG